MDSKQKDELKKLGLDYDNSTKEELAIALLKLVAENRKLKKPVKRLALMDTAPNRGEPNRGRPR